nr:MAG TPA: major capsid protein [Caudoviricetes sp.]
MALTRENLLALAKATAKASINPKANYSFNNESLSYTALNEAFRKEVDELAKTHALYRQNKNLIFELIEVSLSETLPAKVLETYGQFADVKTYAQGDKPTFKVRISDLSKQRAKGFITRVGLAGRYETFKLDGFSFDIPTAAWGGAAQIAFEEFLDGRIQMSDVYDIVLEGLNEAVYKEIAKGLEAMVSDLPAVNVTTQTSFNEGEMDKLLTIADSYGKATIYCTYEFAATLVPADSAQWSDAMKQSKWENGCLLNYKSHKVVVLPQSFTDSTNKEKVIDPAKAYLIPTGSEKPVKVAFEGDAAVRDIDSQEDWSKEIQTYQKFGVAVYNTNPGICVYVNKSLKKVL